jgi:hypothetical protein
MLEKPRGRLFQRDYGSERQRTKECRGMKFPPRRLSVGIDLTQARTQGTASEGKTMEEAIELTGYRIIMGRAKAGNHR